MSDDGPAGERDLAALLADVFPSLIGMEEPILADAGLSMWEYAIMTVLDQDDAVSQVELSRRSHRDPTRLGRHLDDLGARGLVTRTRAQDGRQRTVGLTDEGRVLHRDTKRRIRAAEDEYLGDRLSAADGALLRDLLRRLAES
ncbi:MarR family transcriptional regulator [Tsukamurella sp. 8F]|uniref:MarR family winged helix-turn-helix transcriptional regulator n=1 Tax=unclassified Tsukamurella TaxID=2633480 RepID=UPI0023B937D8|nr:MULTISPECIES: MarR family transcriptional regulator [unclassified Tsukamurella]MDF0529988.1 MarR family transcriptional regulator [Tsukamurella sp. 8J]MDF0587240.1 MarR family transcriptional regulator [Tsukamurella sp. 8F]